MKSNEILPKTSFQGAIRAPRASNQGVKISNISFDFMQNMIFIGKIDFLQNEIVKKALVLIAKQLQQQ